MQRWVLIGIGVAIVLTAGAVLLLFFNNAPTLSGVGVPDSRCIGEADACLTFPAINGENLSGQAFNLPQDFAGVTTLVIMPFDEAQQVKASSWLPLARELSLSQPELTYYNLPVFPNMSAPLRAFIRAGMNVSITDPALRELTITAFLDDRDAFLTALDTPNTDEMQVFLLNADGDVIWRGSSEFTNEQGESLRATLAG